MRKLVKTFIGSILLVQGMAASADVVPFSGTVTGVSSLIGFDPACGAGNFRTAIDPASTDGHSPLGDFHFGTSTCISPGGGTSSGTFHIYFATDEFSGTFDGGSTPTDTLGISNTEWLFTILDGTGRFAGASGTFEGAGLADARTRPTHVGIAFFGDVNAPALPEPASWALMILGFGAVGLALRRRAGPMLQQIA